MIQVLILEDNIYKVHKLFNQEYLKFENKTWVVTAHELEAARILSLQVEAVDLYLDYELKSGCGDGFAFLLSVPVEKLRKVYITSFNREVSRGMAAYCKEHNIPVEALRL